MRHFHSLRARLVIIVVSSAILLTILLSSVMILALITARNQALDKSTSGLEEQSQVHLTHLIDQTARLNDERISSASAAGLVTEQAVLAVEAQDLRYLTYTQTIQLTRRPNGDLVDTRVERATSILIPRDANPVATSEDLKSAVILASILPRQYQTVRNVLAITFIGASGFVQTYPPVDLIAQPPRHNRSLFEHFSGGTHGQIWLQPYKDPIGGEFIATIITPIYVKDGSSVDRLRGVIAIDISLNYFADDLTRLLPTQRSYAFLIDEQRRLIAATPGALDHLIPHLRHEQPAGNITETVVITNTTSPELDAALQRMVGGSAATERVAANGQTYFLAYAQLKETQWRLGIMAPIDELTSLATDVSETITSTSKQALLATLVSAIIFVALTTVVTIFLSLHLTRPLIQLAGAARAISHGDYKQQVPVRSQDEIGEVAVAFNTMSESVLRAREELQDQNRQLEETVQSRTATLQHTVAQLETALARQSELHDLLQAVSTPVIPVAQNVLLMPLIGILEGQRAQQALESLLQHVQNQQARIVILDVTGLPIIDTGVASILLNAAQAARLLGAKTILAGIRPEVAQTLVTLGVKLDQFHPVADLQAAIEIALRRAEPRARFM